MLLVAATSSANTSVFHDMMRKLFAVVKRRTSRVNYTTTTNDTAQAQSNTYVWNLAVRVTDCSVRWCPQPCKHTRSWQRLRGCVCCMACIATRSIAVARRPRPVSGSAACTNDLAVGQYDRYANCVNCPGSVDVPHVIRHLGKSGAF